MGTNRKRARELCSELNVSATVNLTPKVTVMEPEEQIPCELSNEVNQSYFT